MTSGLVLCADDFGRSRAINEAVLALARRGVLTAASVMVGEPHAASDAPALLALPTFEIGLHVTLTDATAIIDGSELADDGRLPTIDRLTSDAYRRRLPLLAVAHEVEEQFDRFQAIFGRAPDFVDAHQHAHLLPGIRDIVLWAAARRDTAMWVRTCEDRLSAIMGRGGDRTRAMRSALLSRGLSRDTARLGLRTNDSFAGLYDLRRTDFAGLFERFLRHPGRRNHLVICHPATEADPGDPIGEARSTEFAYLLEAPVEQLAASQGLAIGTFR